jgi:hypothetical protein
LSHTLASLHLGRKPKARVVIINDIHKKHILGHMIARIYVIEFQKCGLPHAHIFMFFAEDYKPHIIEDVDRMINAELLNP